MPTKGKSKHLNPIRSRNIHGLSQSLYGLQENDSIHPINDQGIVAVLGHEFQLFVIVHIDKVDQGATKDRESHNGFRLAVIEVNSAVLDVGHPDVDLVIDIENLGLGIDQIGRASCR